MRRCRQTCSRYPVPGKVAHRRAPWKSWSSHPLPALAPTLAPPASSQKHLPTPVGPTPSPSKKTSAVAKRPQLPPDPLSLAPAWPLPLPAHQTQFYLGCGSTWSRCGPSSSPPEPTFYHRVLHLPCSPPGPLFRLAPGTYRASAACMFPAPCALFGTLCVGTPQGTPIAQLFLLLCTRMLGWLSGGKSPATNDWCVHFTCGQRAFLSTDRNVTPSPH